MNLNSDVQNNSPKIPFVSVVIPCRNEEKYIGDLIESIVRQDYPKEKTEVIIADGMETAEDLGDYLLRKGIITQSGYDALITKTIS